MQNIQKRWGYWIATVLMILGTALLLAGIIFFFAFNWQNMLKFQKFSIIEFGIFICTAGALYYSAPPYRGLLLTGASVLTGVFLAVFGQIYQTGADAYQLFAVWALLILPWTVIAKFSPLWMIWGIIVNIFVGLYWESFNDHLGLLLLAINTIFLIGIEKVFVPSIRWMRITITFFLILMSYLAVFRIILKLLAYDFFHPMEIPWDPHAPYYFAVWGLGILIGFVYFYSKKRVDFVVLSATFIAIALLCCVLFSYLLDTLMLNELLSYFIKLIVFLSIFSIVAQFLLKLSRTINIRNS